jgi:uncharacterized protein
MRPRLIFLVGGPDFHPVNRQANIIIEWLGADYAYHTAESLAAFEHLAECDLLVIMGQHWTGWEGRYRSPNETHRRQFERYVQSGRPILAAHAGIASYDDWPRFGELIGFSLDWQGISPSPVGEYAVRTRPTGHPVIEGIDDFVISDELLPGVQITHGLRVQTHADAVWDGKKIPVIQTAQGGRILGAGKTAYLALGHDLSAMQSPHLQQLWINTIQWCLSDR